MKTIFKIYIMVVRHCAWQILSSLGAELLVAMLGPIGLQVYEKQVQAAISNHDNVTFDFIRSWWDQPTFKEYWVKALSKCVHNAKDVFVIFASNFVDSGNSISDIPDNHEFRQI